MKLSNLWGFGKKQRIKDLEEIRDLLQQRYDELSEKYNNNDYRYFEDYCKYKDKNERLIKQNNEYKAKLDELEAEIKSLNCAKGGFTKTINKLTKENEELKEQLEESMTNKYLVRKVPEGRTPKKQTIRTKGSSQPSKIIKKIKETE